MTSNTLLIVLGIIGIGLLVGGAFALPDILQGIRDLTKDFRDFFLEDFGDIFGNKTTSDYVGLGILIVYEDGTEEYYAPDESYVILPLTVYLYETGNPIASITWTLQAKLTWGGELTSIAISGTLETRTAQGIVIKTNEFLYTGGVPSEDEWFEIDSITLTDAEIENALYPMGSYAINGNADVLINADFSDGSTDERMAYTSSGVMIYIETGGLSVVSVEVSVGTTSPP